STASEHRDQVASGGAVDGLLVRLQGRRRHGGAAGPGVGAAGAAVGDAAQLLVARRGVRAVLVHDAHAAPRDLAQLRLLAGRASGLLGLLQGQLSALSVGTMVFGRVVMPGMVTSTSAKASRAQPRASSSESTP